MILVILILAFILRVISLNQSLWLDEAINIVAARNNSLFNFIFSYSIGDFHPPLYFLLLWVWGHLFGFSEIAVRLLSVFLGVGSVYLLYLVGKDFFSRKVGLLSSLLLATAPLVVYYSQEARMYSLDVLVTIFCFWSFLKLIHNRKFAFFCFALSTSLVLLSDYLLYSIFIAQFIYILFLKRDMIKIYLVSATVGFIPFLFWIPTFIKQLQTGLAGASILPGWASVVGGASLKNLYLLAAKSYIGRISIDNDLIYIVIVILLTLCYGYIIIRSFKSNKSQNILPILWFAIPIVLSFFVSFFIPVFSYFRLIFVLPAFYILLGVGLTHFSKKIIIILLSIILIINLTCLFIFYLNPRFQREDWKSATNFIRESKTINEAIVFENDNEFSPFIYYYPSTQDIVYGLKKIPAQSTQDVNPIGKQYKKIYLFEYLVDVTDQKRFLEKKLQEDGFKETNSKNFNGVGLIKIYER